jgi:hypothetical protein
VIGGVSEFRSESKPWITPVRFISFADMIDSIDETSELLGQQPVSPIQNDLIRFAVNAESIASTPTIRITIAIHYINV